LNEVVHNFEVFFEYSRSKLKNLAGRKVRLYLLHVKCRKETMKKRQQNSKHETGCILSEKKKLYILRRQNIYIYKKRF
jgi:hypothetical protein